MPYIQSEAREKIDPTQPYRGRYPQTVGELNYIFSMISKHYFECNPCYQSINDIVGALEGAKLEFYRRVAVPYETEKIQANGDVY